MNQQLLRRLLATAAAAALAGCATPKPVDGTGQPQAAAQKAEPPAAAPAPPQAAPKPEAAKSAEPARPAEAAKDAGKAEGTQGTPAGIKAATPEKAPEPITGAFGLTLGERFAPAMAAKVVSQQEHGYRDRNKVERKGTLYTVEPKAPHEAFGEYLVATTATGIIYSVSGSYADPEKKSKCEVTRRLAADLEKKYGEPRGKGSFGNWYSFRDMSVKEFRGVRLYAPKCRSGRYSIVYTDDAAKSPPR